VSLATIIIAPQKNADQNELEMSSIYMCCEYSIQDRFLN